MLQKVGGVTFKSNSPIHKVGVRLPVLWGQCTSLAIRLSVICHVTNKMGSTTREHIFFSFKSVDVQNLL